MPPPAAGRAPRRPARGRQPGARARAGRRRPCAAARPLRRPALGGPARSPRRACSRPATPPRAVLRPAHGGSRPPGHRRRCARAAAPPPSSGPPGPTCTQTLKDVVRRRSRTSPRGIGQAQGGLHRPREPGVRLRCLRHRRAPRLRAGRRASAPTRLGLEQEHGDGGRSMLVRRARVNYVIVGHMCRCATSGSRRWRTWSGPTRATSPPLHPIQRPGGRRRATGLARARRSRSRPCSRCPTAYAGAPFCPALVPGQLYRERLPRLRGLV